MDKREQLLTLTKDYKPKRNFVLQNQHIQGKLKILREIHLFWRNFMREAEDKQRRADTHQRESTRIASLMTKQQKWNRFREDRATVLQMYVEVRQRQVNLHEFISLIKCSHILKTCASNFLTMKDRRAKRLRGIFCILKMKVRFRRKLRNQKRGLRFSLLQNLRSFFTTIGFMLNS